MKSLRSSMFAKDHEEQQHPFFLSWEQATPKKLQAKKQKIIIQVIDPMDIARVEYELDNHKMAELLEAHPKVSGDLNTTIKFVVSLKIPYIAPSFGGCESIMDQPIIILLYKIKRVKL
ncbi:hypothetical protein L1987_85180 [Smallanthus sonchifolius]|uniref:Uncharacterized protein n=1 Tax=Smallanthus sonchifolius TaxID=185202 RepID=A0ACB8Y003_9ASTR|nr:hypothetical protein L1987_85180 [Smallanthus sonchifolius]